MPDQMTPPIIIAADGRAAIATIIATEDMRPIVRTRPINGPFAVFTWRDAPACWVERIARLVFRIEGPVFSFAGFTVGAAVAISTVIPDRFVCGQFGMTPATPYVID